MGYLCAADATAMAAEAQAECLLALEEMDAVKTATRVKVLGAFTAAQGYSADGDYSPRSWLIHRTKVTRGAVAGYLAWVRRAAAHPRIAAALAEAALSESYARTICGWSDKLPPDCRDAADAILVAAAAAGAHRRTWPRWPPRCTPGSSPTTRPTPGSPLMTAGSPWRRPSKAPG